MATRRITVVHDGVERDVALFAGLEADELSDLLTSVFKLSNDISVVGKIVIRIDIPFFLPFFLSFVLHSITNPTETLICLSNTFFL